MDYSASLGLNGGHAEDIGLTPSGEPVRIADHQHEVEIDIHRVELAVSRIFNLNWDAQITVPWFVKDQTAEVRFPSPASAEDRAAAIRNGQIHHRTESYDGFGDVEVTVGWRNYGMFIDEDTLRIGFGLALPTGATEADPWVLGHAGEEHLHIQFGNGTVDPVLDFYYGVPLDDAWAVSVFGKVRTPLYANSDGYRGSIEALIAPRLNFRPSSRLSFSAGATFSYFGRSHWDATGTDPNSGAVQGYASFGAGYIFGENLTASLTLQLPLFTELLGDEDGLEGAPVYGLSVSRQF